MSRPGPTGADEVWTRLKDPLTLAKALWPGVTFYAAQRDIIYSVRDNDETFVAAGHQLGKDFVAGFIALWFFLTRHPCRVVTTSADYSQLESVLWGEIRRFIETSRLPLKHEEGGPLVVNHLHLRKVHRGRLCGVSYMIGRQAVKGEGMAGHHCTPESMSPEQLAALDPGRPVDFDDGIPRTLFIADEASGVDDLSYERADTWAKRKLVIGNPYDCQNFFKRGIKAGDILANDAGRAVG